MQRQIACPFFSKAVRSPCYPFLHRLDEPPVRDRVKVAFYVALYHPLVAAPIALQAIPNV